MRGEGRRERKGRKEMEGEWTLKNATKVSSDKWFHSVPTHQAHGGTSAHEQSNE